MTATNTAPIDAAREPELPRAAAFLDALLAIGTTHVIGIPDNGSDRLFALLEDHADVTLLTVTREGEAFAIAAGLWIGGARPVVLIQNTGLLESGDSLRGTVLRAGMPLLVLVGYRGWGSLAEGDPDDPDLILNPHVDSVAVLTEPTLRAWGVPFHVHGTDADTRFVSAAWTEAETTGRTVAILLTRSFR